MTRPRGRERPAWLPLAGVVALAFALRLATLLEIRSVAFFEHPVSDARAYLEWAGEIARGDWLGRGVFYQAPLYPYWLALGQRLVGADPFALRLLQAALGALACGVVARAGGLFFSRRVGLLAGILMAVYAPAVYYDVLIQKAGLAFFWTALLLLALGHAQRRPAAGRFALAGGALGLLSLTRENALLLAPVLVGWLWLRFAARRPGVRAVWAAALLAGAGAVLLPVGARNLAVGGEFALTTAQLGPNFFIGNHPGAPGVYVPLRAARGAQRYERTDATQIAEADLGRKLTPGEVSRYWLGRSAAFIAEQPGAWLRLALRKLWLTVNAYEIPDTEDLRFYAAHSATLRALAVAGHLGVLLPLAAGGIAFSWPRRRELALLYALLASVALGVAAFYVMGRYRHPMSPILALFAASFLARSADALRRWRPRRLWVPGLVAVCAAVVANGPVVSRREARDQLAVSWSNAGEALFRDGAHESALAHYRAAVEISPDYPSPRLGIAKVLAATGHLAEARAEQRRARELAPGAVQLDLEFAEVLAEAGEPELAVEYLTRALARWPDHADGWQRLGGVQLAAGRCGAALAAFERARGLAPDAPGLAGELALARRCASGARAPGAAP